MPEPTPSTMTALHQFGAEMLKLSKRLESYPTAAVAAPKQPLPPSPLLLPSSTYSLHSSTHRLIRSTTNASIVNQRANNQHEVGDDTSAHYGTNTRSGGSGGGDDDNSVDYLKATRSSQGQQQQQQETTSIPAEQRRYISRTCKEEPRDQGTFLKCAAG